MHEIDLEPGAVAAGVVLEAGLDAARLRPRRRVPLAVLLLGVPDALDSGGAARAAEAVLAALVLLTLAGHLGQQVVLQHALGKTTVGLMLCSNLLLLQNFLYSRSLVLSHASSG